MGFDWNQEDHHWIACQAVPEGRGKARGQPLRTGLYAEQAGANLERGTQKVGDPPGPETWSEVAPQPLFSRPRENHLSLARTSFSLPAELDILQLRRKS